MSAMADTGMRAAAGTGGTGCRRVAVTGMGVLCAAGAGREAFAAALRAGRSGVAPVTAFDAGACRARTAGMLQAFNVSDYLESQKAYLDRSAEIAYAAMSLALEDANLGGDDIRGAATGLLLGSAYGGLKTMAVFLDDLVRKGPRFVKPFLFPHTFSNTAISLLAIDYGLKGLHLNFSAGGVSAACAIAQGVDFIREGRAQVVLAGGFEALDETLFRCLDRLGVLSPGDGKAERGAPMDVARNGFVAGEGGGIVVLEEWERAKKRGAVVKGEILGVGMASDGSLAVRESGAGNGVFQAMQRARAEAGAAGGQPGGVCAAANGSLYLDHNEAAAIAEMAGPGMGALPVTCVKSLTGETMGASGALNLIAALEMLAGGFVAPTANVETPLKACGPASGEGAGEGAGTSLDLVWKTARAGRLASLLVNAIDPGGAVVSLLAGPGKEG